MRLDIRIFTEPVPLTVSHSFLVGHESGGLSGPVATLRIEASLTLRELRRRIEVLEDRGMLRRTLAYQEIHYALGGQDYAFAKLGDDARPTPPLEDEETACGALFRGGEERVLVVVRREREGPARAACAAR